jgi:hypothetical protein
MKFGGACIREGQGGSWKGDKKGWTVRLNYEIQSCRKFSVGTQNIKNIFMTSIEFEKFYFPKFKMVLGPFRKKKVRTYS